MPLWGKQKESGQPPPSASGEPEAVLRDELGLHQQWYFELRLGHELARASRANTVFSFVCWRPRFLVGGGMGPEDIHKTAQFLVERLRSYDLLVALDDYRFLAILLDADFQTASSVAYRIKMDLQARLPATGRWQSGVSTFGRDGVDKDSLLQAAFRRIEEDFMAA